MDSLAAVLWDVYEKQKLQGMVVGMRQTLLKLQKSGFKDARWFNAMGEVALLEKNYPLAARFFIQALKMDSRPEYELNLANTHYFSEDYKASKEIVERYLARAPQDYHAQINLANCWIRLGEPAKARLVCEDALKASPGRSIFLNCLGQISSIEGDFQKALEFFTDAYHEAPDSIDALYNCANMKYLLGRAGEALEDYALCLRKDENYECAAQNMAVLLMEEGRFLEAREKIQVALRLNPLSAETHYTLGRIRMGEREYRLARDAFKSALEMESGHTPSILGMAKLHVIESEAQEAIALVKRVLARGRLKPQERKAALYILFESGEFNACLKYLAEIPESENHSEYVLIETTCLWKIGRKEEATRRLENQIQIHGESSETLTLLGKMLQGNGAEILAEKRFLKALELDPGALEAAFEVAYIFQSRGTDEVAIQVLKQALKHHPGHPDCCFNLACCFSRLKNLDDSLFYLREAVRGGFHDLDKITGDEDLQYLRQFEQYSQLVGEAGIL